METQSPASLTITPPTPNVLQTRFPGSQATSTSTTASVVPIPEDENETAHERIVRVTGEGSGNIDAKKWKFAYYCSSHGFGHATRVAALTSSLLLCGHSVTIVTSAPRFIFASVIERGAQYRLAQVDPMVYQPTAYTMDRRRTVDALKEFLEGREETLEREKTWLLKEGVDCVLSDAVFAGCAAANLASIPSSIVSNFTFDPVYSYLSSPSSSKLPEDQTIPSSELFPLVSLVTSDYACASLLLRLPGVIPLPSFDKSDAGVDLLDATTWVDLEKGSFTKEVERLLVDPEPGEKSMAKGKRKSQKIVDVPLIFRPISSFVKNSPETFKITFLTSLGVPNSLHNHNILLVSFGGQSIPKPRSQTSTPRVSPRSSPRHSMLVTPAKNNTLPLPPSPNSGALPLPSPALPFPTKILNEEPEAMTLEHGEDGKSSSTLLPDGWIALICGLGPKAVKEVKMELPERFFVIEDKDVYVPDLTKISDVVLGKLGYGTCSETLSTRTPFIFVPRPLFVEEYGLKRLMKSQGVCVEMKREDFEEGTWAGYVLEAFRLGEERRKKGEEEEEKEDAGLVIVRELERFLEERVKEDTP
ncbi:hypothetical protein BT69DRAFT_1257396 [Atractiella rhizophila]|nr:hypothetical protein BT69DRAFT_1257396 [Atractiella rhizophila]